MSIQPKPRVVEALIVEGHFRNFPQLERAVQAVSKDEAIKFDVADVGFLAFRKVGRTAKENICEFFRSFMIFWETIGHRIKMGNDKRYREQIKFAATVISDLVKAAQTVKPVMPPSTEKPEGPKPTPPQPNPQPEVEQPVPGPKPEQPKPEKTKTPGKLTKEEMTQILDAAGKAQYENFVSVSEENDMIAKALKAAKAAEDLKKAEETFVEKFIQEHKQVVQEKLADFEKKKAANTQKLTDKQKEFVTIQDELARLSLDQLFSIEPKDQNAEQKAQLAQLAKKVEVLKAAKPIWKTEFDALEQEVKSGIEKLDAQQQALAEKAKLITPETAKEQFKVHSELQDLDRQYAELVELTKANDQKLAVKKKEKAEMEQRLAVLKADPILSIDLTTATGEDQAAHEQKQTEIQTLTTQIGSWQAEYDQLKSGFSQEQNELGAKCDLAYNLALSKVFQI